MVISDTFKLVSGIDEDSIDNSFELIYPIEGSNEYGKIEVFDEVREVFEALGNYQGITNSQFLKLIQVDPEYFTSKDFNKYDYELIFQALVKEK